ncbi:MAG: hypothetical protein NT175_00620 [Bacteroidetes bacterium]|nr:hypothetical protein [Bacteroidota bacterium]
MSVIYKYLFPAVLMIINFQVSTAADSVRVKYPFLKTAIEIFKEIRPALPPETILNSKIDSLIADQEQHPEMETSFQVSTLIGQLLLERGEHPRALELYKSIYEYLSLNESPTSATEQKKAGIYKVIGAIYEETGAWDQAMDYYIKAMHICDSLGWKDGIAMVSNNLGKLYFNQK